MRCKGLGNSVFPAADELTFVASMQHASNPPGRDRDWRSCEYTMLSPGARGALGLHPRGADAANTQ